MRAVAANSLTATAIVILHAYQLRTRGAAYAAGKHTDATGTTCFSWRGDILVVGLIAHYAAVCADTLSSELGILSRQTPRLITSLTLRKVPRGTNGGVTLLGLGAGFLGSMVMVTVGMYFLPVCTRDTMDTQAGGAGRDTWTTAHRGALMWGLTLWGGLGSVLDSVLGGLLQASVKDARSGKIVEGEGGEKVLVQTGDSDEVVRKRVAAQAKALHGEGAAAVETTQPTQGDKESTSLGTGKPTRVIDTGMDLLDNNDVNFIMAFSMTMGAMAVAAWYWEVPMNSMSTI